MASELPRLVARVEPEFRARFEKSLADFNKKSGAGLSEAQFVQMSVKFCMDYLERHGTFFLPVVAAEGLYPEHTDTAHAQAAEAPAAGLKAAALEAKYAAPAATPPTKIRKVAR